MLTKEERIKKYPSITFVCAWCKTKVITDSSVKCDKRTRFCCAKCEHKWWKKGKRRIKGDLH